LIFQPIADILAPPVLLTTLGFEYKENVRANSLSCIAGTFFRDLPFLNTGCSMDSQAIEIGGGTAKRPLA